MIKRSGRDQEIGTQLAERGLEMERRTGSAGGLGEGSSKHGSFPGLRYLERTQDMKKGFAVQGVISLSSKSPPL